MTDNTPNLVDAIRAVLPHASTDNTLRILNGVRVVSGEVWATDRFTLARATFDAEYMDDHDIFVSVGTAKMILAAKSPLASIGLSDDGESATLRLVNGQTFQVPATSKMGDYPNVSRLLPTGEPVATENIALRWENLDKFAPKHFPHKDARARRYHAPRLAMYGETKPVQITFGEFPWYVGLIVPVCITN